MDTQRLKVMWTTDLANTSDNILGDRSLQTGANCVGPVPIAMELLKAHFSVKYLPSASNGSDNGVGELPSYNNAYWSDLGFVPINVSTGGNIQRSGGVVTEAWIILDHEWEGGASSSSKLNEEKRIATYKRSTVADAISGGTATRWHTRSREEGEWWDFTDGAGNGMIVASDKIHFSGIHYLWNMNTGTNLVVDEASMSNFAVRVTVDLFYRMRAVTIQKFISACAD